MERRDFVRLAAAAGAMGAWHAATGCASPRTDPVGYDAIRKDMREATTDEAFWRTVRRFYSPPEAYVDLDHANTAPAAGPVFDAFLERVRRLNRSPAEEFEAMWADDLEKGARPPLAAYLGTQPRHLAFVANATAALNTVLHGFQLNAGDEILVTNHEYPDMVETVHQRAQRGGLSIRTVDVPAPDEDRLVLVERVENAITPRTKLLLISHVSAWNGEVLPVAEVTAAARARGVAVLVDAAQSVGVLPVDFEAIGCDFLGASLHKGVGAPMTTGVLVMRPERVPEVWPLHPPSWPTEEFPMDKYEWSGTFNMAALATIPDALTFQQELGRERKAARLRALGAYWQEQIRALPGVRMLTPTHRDRACGPASFAVDGVPSEALAKHLRLKHQLTVQDKAGRHSPFANAIRVSPAAHGLNEELDRLVAAVADVARNGLQ